MFSERGKGRMIEAGISAAQCRAARAAVQWSQEELAERAMVSRATLEKFENGRGTPNTNNLRSIRVAFEAAGFRFVVAPEAERAEMTFPEVWK